MKNKYSFFEKYKNQIMAFLVGTGLVFGVIGAYLYYSEPIESTPTLISAIVFSTIKLFLFSPSISIDNPNSNIFYQIAIWLAPLATVLGFFTVFNKSYYFIKAWLRSKRSDRHIVVSEGERGMRLLTNLLREDKNTSGYLILKEDGAQLLGPQLNKSGARLASIDWENDSDIVIKDKLKTIGISKAREIIFFDSDMVNFSNLKKLVNNLDKRPEGYKVIMKYESKQLKEIIEEEVDGLDGIDTRFINIEEKMSEDLLGRKFKIPLGPKPDKAYNDLTLADMSKIFPPAHVLIIGFGKLGKSLFRSIVNRGVSCHDWPISISIVDSNLANKYDKFQRVHEKIEEFVDVNLFEVDVLERDFYDEIKNINEIKKIDFIAFAIKDYQASVISLNKLKNLLPDRTVAVRTSQEVLATPFFERLSSYYKDISFFGSDQEILSSQFVLEEDIENKAKIFNSDYNKVLNQIMGWEEEKRSIESQWTDLNTLKKESSIAQSLHMDTKVQMIEHLIKLGYLEGSVNSVVKNGRKKFRTWILKSSCPTF